MSARFRQWRRLAVALVLVLPMGGYPSGDAGRDPPADIRAPLAAFTPQQARQALIEMFCSAEGGEAAFYGLGLMEDPTEGTVRQALLDRILIVDGSEEGILGGHWNCNLERKRFTFARQLGKTGFYGCSGVFEQSGGKWRARITGWERACPRGD